jgi:hypothetical protein
MMWKIVSPRRLIKEHFNAIHDDSSPLSRWTLFFIGPFTVSIVITFVLMKPITYSLIAILIPAYSIFAGLLLNAVFVIFDIVGKPSEESYEDKAKLFRSLYFNSLYTILVSIVTIVILIFSVACDPWSFQPILIVTDTIEIRIGLDSILSVIIYTIILHFVSNLMIVLKRLESLLTAQIDGVNKQMPSELKSDSP